MSTQPPPEDRELPPLDDLLSKIDQSRLDEILIDLLTETDFNILTTEELQTLLGIMQGAIARRDAAGKPPGKPEESLAAVVERRRQSGTADAPKAVTDFFANVSRVASNLTKPQLETLLEQLMKGQMWGVDVGSASGESLANLIEPTSPEIARQVRSLTSPETIAIYVATLISLLQLILAAIDLLNEPPSSPNQHIEIHIDTDVTNFPAPPPAEGGQGQP